MVQESLHLSTRLGLTLLKLHRDTHRGDIGSQDYGYYHDSIGVLQQKEHFTPFT